ncbi:MAG TPA: glycosyltransferase [Vitreimonas sp.]|nr:glycosyltransferase [Vitreimonas sp.]
MAKYLKVSAVIPTYNGLHLLRKNLSAVLECLRPNDELVIVDDASNDETLEWLKHKFGLATATAVITGADLSEGMYRQGQKKVVVKVVANHQNQRFAVSCNRGVAAATHPIIFVLNNDVSPYPDVIKQALPHFQDPEVFAVGCLEHEQAEGEVGGKNRLWFERGLFRHARASDFSTGPTAWVSGGSGFFDREKWLQLDGFDPRYYPAYWEDTDLSFRARQQGWKVVFDAQAQVDHNHESTNQTTFGKQHIMKMSWQHAHIFTRQHATWWQLVQYGVWFPYNWWHFQQLMRHV